MTKNTKSKQADKKQDKENESVSLQFEIGKAIKALQTRCKDWQSNELAASNKIKYGIMADMWAEAEKVIGNRSRTQALNRFIETQNIRFRGSPSVVDRYARLTFGENTKLASKVGLVIKAAKRAGVEPSGLANWIEDQGGVEEVRTGHSKTGASRTQLRALGELELDQHPSIATFPRTKFTPAEADFVVMYGYVDNAGVTHISAYSSSESIQKAFLEDIGRRRFRKERSSDSTSNVPALIEKIAGKTKSAAA